MKKAVLRRRIVLGICALYFVFYVILAVRNAERGDWDLLNSIPVLIISFAILMGGMYCFNLKRALIAVFSSRTQFPARPEDFAELDVAGLERLTTQWEALGFVQAGDSGWRFSNSSQGTTFSRLFEHPTEGAVVEVLQQFLPLKTIPISSLVESFWGRREQVEEQASELERIVNSTAPLASPTSVTSQVKFQSGEQLELWALLTHNRAPNRFFPLLRHPRVLGGRLEPHTTPAQIWEIHRERAALVEQKLGSPRLRDNLQVLGEAHGRVIVNILLGRVKATSPLALARYSLSRKPQPPFYDGELAPLESVTVTS